MMRIVNVLFAIILPFTIAKPQPIEQKNDTIIMEQNKVEYKINDSLIDVVNSELERSKKINDELKEAIKKELETEKMKNEKIYKIIKNVKKTD